MKSVLKFAGGVMMSTAVLAQPSAASACSKVFLKEGRCESSRWDVSCKAKGVAENGAKVKLNYAYDETAHAVLKVEETVLSLRFGRRDDDGMIRSAQLRELIQGLEKAEKRGHRCRLELCVDVGVDSGVRAAAIRSGRLDCQD